MTNKSDNTQSDLKFEDSHMDTSIDDAKWMLGGVATLGLIVMSLGLFASTLAA